MYVTQISNLLKHGNRKKTHPHFTSLARGDTAKTDLKVLVSASDRLKETGFAGVLTTIEEEQKSKHDLKKRQKVRPGKSHLKFPLYLDEQIGFGLKNAQSDDDGLDVSTLRNLHDAVS